MYYKQILTALFFLFTSFTVFSQTGKIVGKLVNGSTGDVLIGASVLLNGSSRGTTTDQNGTYSFSNLKPGTYSITCTYVGLEKKTVEAIVVKAGDVTTQDVVLSVAASTEIVIKSNRINKDNTSALLLTQKNSPNFSDGISAEAIRRTPDRSTSDVLKRISGAAIQDDKFAIIRGINDRYNAAFINGAPLPSSESDKKSFAFDIFPSNILDNLVILKTATPDQTAEFGGGIINITTKSIPDKDFQTISFGLGVNTNSTFKTQKYYKHGRWDFLGLDDGGRELPYNFPNKEQFKSLSIDDKGKYGKALGAYDWKLYSGFTAPNISFQYAAGITMPKKGKDFFGGILSITYNRSFDSYAGERNTWEATINSNIPSVQIGKYTDRVYTQETLLGVLANFSFKLNNYNTIGFKNLLSINSDDKVILREGWSDYSQANDIYDRNTAYWFTSNFIVNSQLTGEHFIKAAKIKINWIGSYSNIKRNIPNLRRMQYRGSLTTSEFFANIDQGVSAITEGAGIHFFSKNGEKLYSGKIDISRSFSLGKLLKNEIKTGLNFQDRNRDFDARTLQVLRYQIPGANSFDPSLLSKSVEDIFDKTNFGKLGRGKTGFLIEDGSQARDGYNGVSTTLAFYGMMDTRVGKFARFIYGARLEDFKQTLTSLGAGFNDTVRVFNNQYRFFPSVSAVFSVTKKMNLRLAYSETVNRPEFRELAPFVFYDIAQNLSISGNPLLKNSLIYNTDLRFEFFPGRSQLFSFSVFNKEFKYPIEIFIIPATTNFATYDFVENARVRGAELEFRTIIGPIFNIDKGPLSNLTFFSNLAIIKSEVSLLGGTVAKATRQLQGQSPYIINGGLTYLDADKGYSFNLIANRVGPRIIALGSNGTPDFFENARTVVDFQAAYTIKKNLELKFNARDLLAQQLVLFQDFNANNKYNKDVDLIFGARNFGRGFSLNISYKF